MARRSVFRTDFWTALLAVVLSVWTLVIPAAATAAAPSRIMALGDSITGSPGCWRALLWQHMRNTGYTNVDFVGTLPAQGCGFTYDGENEGHGGFLATGIAGNNQLPGWLSATQPDIVLMHLGTNDVWNNIPAATILSAYSTLLGQMRASNPAMKVLVAKIIPMNPSGCGECAQRVVTLNNAIPGWAQSNSTTASPITVVDQWTGFSTSADTSDGVHPNSSTGIQKIESRWYPALTALLTPGTTPPPTGDTLVGTQSGRCLDVVGGTGLPTGAQVQLWDCTGQANQQWASTSANELRVGGTASCLAGSNQGTIVTIADCDGGSGQKWTLNTNRTITAAQSGLCLDANGQGTANGTRILLWTCNGQTNQQWAWR